MGERHITTEVALYLKFQAGQARAIMYEPGYLIAQKVILQVQACHVGPLSSGKQQHILWGENGDAVDMLVYQFADGAVCC